MTTGGELYVLKFSGMTGKYGLMGEVVGTELMCLLGLPVPQWAAIRVTDEFLDQHPEVWYRSGPDSAAIRPESGLHFGSRLTLSAGKQQTYEILPGAWADRVANREDFVGALLVDLWANNCDRRQCVFLAEAASSSFRAVFIDHDHMFGGYYGNERTCARRAMVPDARFYGGVWCDDVVGGWESAIGGVDTASLQAILGHVPSAWADASARAFAMNQLQGRQARLNSLIDEASVAIGAAACRLQCRPRDAAQPHWPGGFA
jgi:hypothetical protein